MASFSGKVALVTGGGSGIGEKSSKTLAALGAKVVVADIAEENGKRVVAEIKDLRGEATFVKTDVTNADQVDALIRAAVDTYGGLDYAHNNAGIVHAPADLHELDLSLWDRVYAINVQSMIFCLRAELAYMVENGGGSIVNGGSGAGLAAPPQLAAYTMSKHAVSGLTRAAAVDYARKGIRINAVAPGTVETPMTAGMSDEQRDELNALMPMGRMAQPQEVADAVVYLLSAESSSVNGVVLPVDGGMSARA